MGPQQLCLTWYGAVSRQDRLELLKESARPVLSYPGAPHLGPRSDLFIALSVSWLSEVILVSPSPAASLEVPRVDMRLFRHCLLCSVAGLRPYSGCLSQSLDSQWSAALRQRITERSKLMVCGRRGWLFAGLKEDALGRLEGLQVCGGAGSF